MKDSSHKARFSFIRGSWFFLVSAIIAIVAFCHFPEAADWHWLLPLNGHYHIPMMLGGLLLTLLLAYVCHRCCRNDAIHRGRLLAVTITLTVVHIILVYSYYVFTDWDVQQLTGAAEAMAEGRPVDEFKDYFRFAPNNLFLTRIFALVFFLTGPLWGLRTMLFPLLVLQCLFAALTALMLFQIAIHLWHKKSLAVMVYLFYSLLVWFSPWWSIPYSDVWGLMAVVTILWLYAVLPFKRRWLKVFLIAAASVTGYYIRPQVLFVGMAIGFVELVAALRSKQALRTLLKPSGIALGGVAAAFLLVHICMIGSPMSLHSRRAFGPTHYLMMGANYQSIGIYSANDVDYSRSFKRKSERARAEMAMTRQRYADLGVDGTLILWGRKMLLNFSDGTFYWGREGQFYKIVPERHSRLSQMTRSVYYNQDHGGRHNVKWGVVNTSLWFGMLLFALMAAFPLRQDATSRNQPTERILKVVMLTLLLLFLFHMLCEARARYLFSFVPLIILLTVEGLRQTKALSSRTKAPTAQRD